MFKLTRPCNNCPFRKGVGPRFRLPRLRLQAIRRAVAFQCHKTVDYAHFNNPEKRSGNHPQQCAGLLAVLHREGEPNQIMQVAMRLGHLDPAKLDPDREAYGSWQGVLLAHGAAA
jgi:hypothetical protein